MSLFYIFLIYCTSIKPHSSQVVNIYQRWCCFQAIDTGSAKKLWHVTLIPCSGCFRWYLGVKKTMEKWRSIHYVDMIWHNFTVITSICNPSPSSGDHDPSETFLLMILSQAHSKFDKKIVSAARALIGIRNHSFQSLGIRCDRRCFSWAFGCFMMFPRDQEDQEPMPGWAGFIQKNGAPNTLCFHAWVIATWIG